jgi:hypothetical protein
MLVHLEGRNNILDTYFYMHTTLVLIADHHHSTILRAISSRCETKPTESKVCRYESMKNGRVIGDVFPLYLEIRASK